MAKKLTKEEVFERISNRDDVRICEETYVGWKQDCQFYDLVVGEHFISTPARIVEKGVCHPIRAMEKRKQTKLELYAPGSVGSQQISDKKKATMLERYGVEHGSKSAVIRDKFKATMLERYGVENPGQAKGYLDKKKATCLERYGVEHASQSEEVKSKWKTTVYERYGVEHISQLPEVKETKRKTTFQNHGVKIPFQIAKVKEAARKTMCEKYGATTYWGSKKISIEDNGKNVGWLCDYWESLSSPKMAYSNLCVQLNKTDGVVTKTDVERVVCSYAQRKSSLETYTESLLGIGLFDRKPHDDLRYKPDFMLSETAYLNVDGLYWHGSLKKKNNSSHLEARKAFEAVGYRLFQIREDEIRRKPQVVLSMINHHLGKSANVVGARKCSVSIVSPKIAKIFLEENHLMGSTSAKHIGLFNNESLVSVLSYRVVGSVLKIERFCSRAHAVIPGGFSRLLKYAVSSHPYVTEAHNWVDLRYGCGDHLKNKGFILTKETLGWKWTDGAKTFNRLQCRANMDSRGLSEKEHADERGWYRIYDAGQRLYVKQI